MPALKDIRQETLAVLIARGVPRAEAVKIAGYTGQPKHNKQRLWKIMQQPAIKARIIELTAKAAIKNEVTVARVIKEMALLAFSSLDDGRIPAAVKRQALADLAKHLRMFAPDVNVNTLVVNQGVAGDTASLERILLGIIEARKRVEQIEQATVIEHQPEPAGERNANDEQPSPLRLVSPPVEISSPPEPKQPTTTEQFFEWSNRPPRPPGSD
jgi:hypothetical protein